VANENGRSLASVIAELKDEFKSFLETRLNMLSSELRDKVAAWKTAMPMIAVGALLLLTAWFLLTGALVALIYVAFWGNPYGPAIALAIVGGGYLLFGAIAAIFAYRSLSETGVVPKRTLRVLREDRLWLANEVRTQI